MKVFAVITCDSVHANEPIGRYQSSSKTDLLYYILSKLILKHICIPLMETNRHF